MAQTENIVELLNAYHKNPVTHTLREKFLTPSLFDIIQKDRSETVHSNFLKWLFDLQGINGVKGFNIISSLLRVAYSRAIEQGKKFPDCLAKAAYGDSTAIQKAGEVIREHKCPGVFYTDKKGKRKPGQEGIVDLVINGTIIPTNNKDNAEITPFKIIIENKVDTDEHDLQTWKYYTFFEGETRDNTPEEIELRETIYEKPNNERRIYLFLTPDPDPVNPECPYFIWFNYQDIMDSCILPLLQSSMLDSRNRMFLEEYCRALSLPYINNANKTTIMSLSTSDAELLKEFWDANKTLITMSLKAVGQSSLDKELKTEVQNALNAITALEGKRRTYVISHRDTDKSTTLSGHTAMVTYIVGMYASNHTADDTEKAFNTTKRPVVFGHSVPKPKDPKRYSQKPLTTKDGKTLWCSNQWIPTTADEFITQVEELGYIVKTLDT